MMYIKFSDIAILNIKCSDYHCIVSLLSKKEAIKLMQNADLTEKQNIIKHKNVFSYIKMGKEILTFGNIEIEKKIFLPSYTSYFLGELDIEKVLVSNNVFFW